VSQDSPGNKSSLREFPEFSEAKTGAATGPARRALTTDLPAWHVADLVESRDFERADGPRVVVFDQTDETFALVATPQPFGGERWNYVCRCQHRCRILYLLNGVARCRSCHYLAYSSQNRPRRPRHSSQGQST
jgi:hypothetical protein